MCCVFGHMITRCMEQVETDADIKVETKLVSVLLSTAITNLCIDQSYCNMTFFQQIQQFFFQAIMAYRELWQESSYMLFTPWWLAGLQFTTSSALAQMTKQNKNKKRLQSLITLMLFKCSYASRVWFELQTKLHCYNKKWLGQHYWPVSQSPQLSSRGQSTTELRNLQKCISKSWQVAALTTTSRHKMSKKCQIIP